MEVEKRNEACLVAFKEAARKKRKGSRQRQKNNDKDIGEWRGEVARHLAPKDYHCIHQELNLRRNLAENIVEASALDMQFVNRRALFVQSRPNGINDDASGYRSYPKPILFDIMNFSDAVNVR